MGKLIVFNQVSLDGYFVDAHGDMSWAHNTSEDEEWDEFVATNARGGGLLVFGRPAGQRAWWRQRPASLPGWTHSVEERLRKASVRSHARLAAA